MAKKNREIPEVILEGVIVKESKTHGLGIFAARPIKFGETVVKWKKREISQTEYAGLTHEEHGYIDIQDGKIFLMGEPEIYVNHSCDPNTVPGDFCDIASRDIQTGEKSQPLI